MKIKINNFILIFRDLLYSSGKGLIILLIGAGTALSAPVIPRDMVWVISYETIAFDTHDGDLAFDEYTVAGEGEWYVRDVPKHRGQFVSTTSPDAIVGKKEVQIRAQKNTDNPDCTGCAYYSEFLGANGTLLRVSEQRGKFEAIRDERNAPTPRRIEFVDALAPQQGDAAIAFDNASDSGNYDNVSSYSWSHTNTAGNIIVVGIGMDDNTDPDRFVTNVTYNGEALTEIREDAFDPQNITTALWYRVNPATGSNTVTVTLLAVNTDTASGAVTLTGADTASPIDASDTDRTSNSSSLSYTLETVADNTWVIDVVAFDDDGNDNNNIVRSGDNVNERWNVSGGNGRKMAGSDGTQATAGTYTVTWDCSGAGCVSVDDDWLGSVVSIAPGAEPEIVRIIRLIGEIRLRDVRLR